jgi:hypothetical protein
MPRALRLPCPWAPIFLAYVAINETRLDSIAPG